ncbi:MAG TPA: hypothetical protein VIM16_15100 [Mucilaginibacter sp.]
MSEANVISCFDSGTSAILPGATLTRPQVFSGGKTRFGYHFFGLFRRQNMFWVPHFRVIPKAKRVLGTTFSANPKAKRVLGTN